MACTPSIMIVEQHFHKARFQALSIAVGGIGCGIIAFPFIIKHLLETYAWRGTMLILAGCAFNLCVCGAMMFPVKKERQVKLLPLLSCFPLRNPIFHGMCIANFFWSFGTTVIYMYLPSYAMELGTNFESSLLLVSCIGMASFTAKTIFAFMGHNSALDDVTAVLCSVCLGVVLTGVSPLMFEKFAGQIGYTLIFGFYGGYWTTFLSQVSRELIGPEYIAMGNGYLSFMVALGGLLGGPCAGNYNSSTVKLLSIFIDRTEQTVQTQIRLLLKEQFFQGLHFCHSISPSVTLPSTQNIVIKKKILPTVPNRFPHPLSHTSLQTEFCS